MITDKLSENNINLIFAVTNNMVDLYRVSFYIFVKRICTMCTNASMFMGCCHVSCIVTELQRADSRLCGRNAFQRLWKCCATHSGCVCGKSLGQELKQPLSCENLLVRRNVFCFCRRSDLRLSWSCWVCQMSYLCS